MVRHWTFNNQLYKQQLKRWNLNACHHYSDVIMGATVSQITGVAIVCSVVCSGANHKKKSRIRTTGLCEGNPPVISGFLSQRAINAENVSIRRRNHDILTESDIHSCRCVSTIYDGTMATFNHHCLFWTVDLPPTPHPPPHPPKIAAISQATFSQCIFLKANL